MTNNLNFEVYNANYDDDFKEYNDWLDVHINLLLNELVDIQTAICIFNIVDKEWEQRICAKDVPKYSAIRNTLHESLVYRIFLGLNKIFADGKEYSLLKATNQVEQLFVGNKEVLEIIEEIRHKLENSMMVKVIRLYRDKFFAHLDRKSVMSHVRIVPTSAMQYIDENELDEWSRLIRKLYKECFGVALSNELVIPCREDVIYTFFWK